MEQDVLCSKAGNGINSPQYMAGLIISVFMAGIVFSALGQGVGVISTSSATGADLDSLFAPPTNSVSITSGITIDNSTGGSDAVYGSSRSWNLTNAATLNGSNAGVNLGAGGSANNLGNGSVSGKNYGVLINGGTGSVVNSGSITGTEDDGVLMHSGGSVNNLSDGTISGNGFAGVAIYGGVGSVANAGLITGTGFDQGVYLNSGGRVDNVTGGAISGYFYGVQIYGGTGSLTNAGWITGRQLGVSLIGRGSVVNSGLIMGTNSVGVNVDGGGIVNNYSGGIISGGNFNHEFDGVDIYGGVGYVTNAGTILSGGACVHLNQGGSVNNLPGGNIAGYINGVEIYGGLGSVINAGSITNSGAGALSYGVFLDAGGSVNNLSGGTITGLGDFGVEIAGGTGSVVNAGSIIGSQYEGVYLGAGGNVINGTNGIITGGKNGVAVAGSGNVDNSGAIRGNGNSGVEISGDGTVANLASGNITGNTNGVNLSGAGRVMNAGIITGTINDGIYLGNGGGIDNQPGGSIIGNGNNGVEVHGTAGSVVNSGSIAGNGNAVFHLDTGNGDGIYLDQGGFVNNLSAGAITGKIDGVDVDGGFGSVVNAGSITGNRHNGIVMLSGGSVSNLAGGMITGYNRGVEMEGSNVFVGNAGSIQGTYDVGVLLNSGGTVNNLSGGTISGGAGADSVAISGGAGIVNNAGSIMGFNNAFGVDLYDGGSVDNLLGGTISGYTGGVRISSGGLGSVTNAGSIMATGQGIIIGNHDSSVINDGLIYGSSGVGMNGGMVNNLRGGTISGYEFNGIDGYGFASHVNNMGLIQGTNGDSIYRAGTYGNGILFAAGGSVNNQSGGIIIGAINGVFIGGNAGLVANAGLIDGQADGVQMAAGGGVTNLLNGILAGDTNGVEIVDGLGAVINEGMIVGTNNDGVFLGYGGSVSNSAGGAISGGVHGVQIAGGPGNVVNRGTITGASSAAIQLDNYSNSVTLQTGAIVYGNIAGGTNFDAAYLQGNGSYNNAFSNFETLTVQANQIGWNLAGTNAFSAGTTVENGLLRVNGQFTSPWVNVTNVSGGLGGSGVINGTVDNHGYFAPGNSIGTLTINGSMTNWGNYYADVNPAGKSDLIQVNGSATINGGEVIVQPASGNYASNTLYTILTATNGVSGSYAGVSSTALFYTGSLSNDLNNIYLTLYRKSFTSVARTFNQNAVAGALDGIANSPGSMSNLISGILSFNSASQAQAALSSLSGDIHGTLGLLDVQQQGVFNNSMAQRTGRISANGRSGDFAGSWKPVHLASGGSTLPPVRMQQAELKEPLGLWFQGIGSFGQLDSDGNAEGGNYTIGGLSGGADYRLTPNLLAGVGLGYSHDYADVGGPGANGKVDAYQIGGYGGYISGAWHLDCILSGGYFQTETKRYINVGSIRQQANGSYDGGLFSLSTEGGYAFKFDWLTVEPTVGLNFNHLWQNSFSETGTASDGNNYGLHVNDVSLDSICSSLGGRLGAQFGMKNGVQFIPSLHALWEHEFANRYADVNASFVGGSPSFDVRGVALGADTALLGGGLTVAFNKTVRGFINYDADLNTQQTSSVISGGFNIFW